MDPPAARAQQQACNADLPLPDMHANDNVQRAVRLQETREVPIAASRALVTSTWASCPHLKRFKDDGGVESYPHLQRKHPWAYMHISRPQALIVCHVDPSVLCRWGAAVGIYIYAPMHSCARTFAPALRLSSEPPEREPSDLAHDTWHRYRAACKLILLSKVPGKRRVKGLPPLLCAL